MESMKQQCYLWNVWLTWIGLPLLAVLVWVKIGFLSTVFVFVVGLYALHLYKRIFPRISKYLGYGSVKDVSPGSAPRSKLPSKVVLYTANVCPFCPIVKRRLLEMQRDFRFDLTEVDVTFRPGVMRRKGLKSVPVIEMDGRYWVGNATSSQLAEFLGRSA